MEPTLAAKTQQRRERLTRDAAQRREWLATHPDDRRGATGAVRQRNRTDNESAKMATGKGVIQGYTAVAAVAAVDAAHQIIVAVQAHGIGSEQELLVPIVAALQPLRGATTMITADAGYHSEANLRALDTMSIDALIADRDMRTRDERFATQGRHQQDPHPLRNKSATPTTSTATVFTSAEFTYDAEARTCVCPAGKSLYRSGGNRKTSNHVGAHFRGAKRDCGPCPLRAQCLRTPDTTPVRNVAFCSSEIDLFYSFNVAFCCGRSSHCARSARPHHSRQEQRSFGIRAPESPGRDKSCAPRSHSPPDAAVSRTCAACVC